jgi:hypothetical protein
MLILYKFIYFDKMGLGKTLIYDLARFSSLCYKPREELMNIYNNKRPYQKVDNACAFLSLRECPKLCKSEEDCEVLLCKYGHGHGHGHGHGVAGVAGVAGDAGDAGDVDGGGREKEKGKGNELLVTKNVIGDALVVAFRGTSSKEDILTDLAIALTELELPSRVHMDIEMSAGAGAGAGLEAGEGVEVHSGFNDQFLSVRDEIDGPVAQHDEVIFCGHSLGGALATIGSLYYATKYPEKSVSCVTFGSPRVGNPKFVELFDNRVKESVRFVNDNDPVPCVPTRWRFKHVKGLQWLNQDEIQNEIKAWRFFRFVKNTMLNVVGFGYNALDDHKCDHYIEDLRTIWFSSTK